MTKKIKVKKLSDGTYKVEQDRPVSPHTSIHDKTELQTIIDDLKRQKAMLEDKIDTFEDILKEINLLP